jgi:hypothetical protein
MIVGSRQLWRYLLPVSIITMLVTPAAVESAKWPILIHRQGPCPGQQNAAMPVTKSSRLIQRIYDDFYRYAADQAIR